jgi:predicted negative regulator of RcsB-dependent stress response
MQKWKMNDNYKLIIVGAIIALVGKIIWDWLSKTRHITRTHSYIEEHYKLMGVVAADLRKMNHGIANLRSLVDVLGVQVQELRNDIREYRSRDRTR